MPSSHSQERHFGVTPVMIVKWIAKIIDIFNPILPPSHPSQIILNISREIAAIGIQLRLIGQNLVSNQYVKEIPELF